MCVGSRYSYLRLLEIGAVVKMRTTNKNGVGNSDEHEQEPDAGPQGAGPQKVRVTPHWNAIGGLVAIGVLYALLPVKISIGPYGLLLLAIEGGKAYLHSLPISIRRDDLDGRQPGMGAWPYSLL